MDFQRKPFPWGCGVTSFAMVLNVPVAQLVDEIGHDGSEVWWPALDEPTCRRNYHAQELIDCCLRRGFAVTEIQAFPRLAPHDLGEGKVVQFGPTLDENWGRFERHIRQSRGVLYGSGLNCQHAVAYDRTSVYDPDGRVYEFSQVACEGRGFCAHTLYRIDPTH